MPKRDYTASIIITTRNRAAHLQATLHSLSAIELPENFSCELIVVDNGSHDATAEVVKENRTLRLPVNYVYEACKGQSYARNTGIAAAKGEIIMFTDDDVRFPKQWVAAMCSPLLTGEADAVAGGVHLAPQRERPWMEPWHRALLAETKRLESAQPLKEMVGANMAFLREALTDVPAFDTELGPGALGFADDSLFALQLSEAGRKIAAAFDASVEHCFEVRRLTRPELMAATKRSAESWAYVKRHWEHSDKFPTVLPLLKRPLRLYYERLRHHGDSPGKEGMPGWEMRILWDIHYLLKLTKMKRQPRNYERRGLVKRPRNERV